MRYLPLLAALFFAAPAWAACQWSTAWPACTVQHSTGVNLEDFWGEHTFYTESTIPTCDSDVHGLTIYVSDATNTNDCTAGTPGSVTSKCFCDDDDTWAASGGLGFDSSETVTGTWTWADAIAAKFGTDGDSSISYDGTNLLINPQLLGSGYTDFTGAIFVAEGEDVFSQFGPTPTATTPTNANDRLVVHKLRTGTSGNKRAIFAFVDIATDLALSTQNYGLNAGVFTDEDNTVSSSRTNGPGGAAGGRYFFRHRAAGAFLKGGGVTSECEVTGRDEDGVITNCYAYYDEGGDGGSCTDDYDTGGPPQTSGSPDGLCDITGAFGGIVNYHGLWVGDSSGNVGTKNGIWIEDLNNADTNIGIRLDGASTAALWFNNDSGTSNDGMFFGTAKDTDWFRSAAGILKTTGAIDANSLTTTEFTVEPDGDTFWAGDGTGVPYGHMYAFETSTNVTINTADQWEEVTIGMTTGANLNEVEFQNSHELKVNKAGRYFIPWSLSIEAAAGAPPEVMGSITVGGADAGVAIGSTSTTAKEAASHGTIFTVGKSINLSGATIVDLDADDVVSFVVLNESGGAGAADLIIEHANMTITMVGGGT